MGQGQDQRLSVTAMVSVGHVDSCVLGTADAGPGSTSSIAKSAHSKWATKRVRRNTMLAARVVTASSVYARLSHRSDITSLPLNRAILYLGLSSIVV